MTLILFAIATLTAFLFVQLAYVVSQAVVGRWIGATVTVISVGFGPIVWRRISRGIEWRFSAIPTGGYTSFFGLNDDAEEFTIDFDDVRLSPQPFSELPVAGRMLLMLTGPLSTIVIGLAALGVPVSCGSPQVTVGPQMDVLLEPRAVPSLGVSNQATTWARQEKLFHDTFLEFWRRAFRFESMTGYGGFVGWLVTCGTAATLSPSTWLTCFGTVCLGIGLINLLPIPVLNGGHLMMLVVEACWGKPPERMVVAVTLVGMTVVFGVWVMIIFLDLSWCAQFIG